ncbi:uncharacterized protein DUF2236 [Tamaricihabitans halophyticus]|uniref:Uncharacterized protein DUF2236 n=1 Tax=Tamaricihabitans halophyticus TaxID=1262583 RepID=A0A4R2QBU9_9PSEU|nr:oxygenase MpaB family protein [Tamaricihabitans halophyticus]TCP45784.1 uncharacterized protein DUF2236 [Tamaricihabitans halophyticus]
MEDFSRRKMLATGGALGALGALGVAAPAAARPLWTWSPAGSVAGSGKGADPRWVWDDVADPLFANLLEKGNVPKFNELLRSWTKNNQPLPPGMPADIRDFLESARQLPAWVDQDKLTVVDEFNKKRGLYFGALYGFGSGMVSTAIPKEARAVYYSLGGWDLRDRLSKTAKLGYDICNAQPYAPENEIIVTCLKTRMIHAAIRHLLPQSSGWQGSADEEIPISQADMMVTWHSLPTHVNRLMTRWEIPVSAEESEAFLHTWQVCAYMLGIKEEYIPASWNEAEEQAKQVFDPVLAPTPEGIKLADQITSMGDRIDGTIMSKGVLESFTRYTLGDEVADFLEIPRHFFWDNLLKRGWPLFIKAREGLIEFPMGPEVFDNFDEILRKVALFYLSEGKKISIEIPERNRPE